MLSLSGFHFAFHLFSFIFIRVPPHSLSASLLSAISGATFFQPFCPIQLTPHVAATNMPHATPKALPLAAAISQQRKGKIIRIFAQSVVVIGKSALN